MWCSLPLLTTPGNSCARMLSSCVSNQTWRAALMVVYCRLLVWCTAAADGTVTDGGLTAVCGPYSGHVQQLLQQGGVSCKVLGSWHDYNSAMVVKLLWSSIFWLLSAGLDGATVSQAYACALAAGGINCCGYGWQCGWVPLMTADDAGPCQEGRRGSVAFVGCA